MAIPVIMPRQGQSVETCIITKWFIQKGESVKTGDLLFSYETDKAAFDFESTADGTLIDVFYPEGSEVAVLSNVAVIGNEGEQSSHYRPAGINPQSDAGFQPDRPSITSENIRKTEIIEKPGIIDKRIKISPRAKLAARAKGIDFNSIKGSGPYGRILYHDIENASPSAPLSGTLTGYPDQEYTDIPLPNVRKLIARSMHSSLTNSAQLTHHMGADVRRLLEVRKNVKNKVMSDRMQQDITLNDMICFCVVRALKKFPEANSHFLDSGIRIFNTIHLGLAVDTPRGLMVPVVRDADTMDLTALSKSLRSAADACKKGSIDPGLIQSTAASFTVSNLGNYGVEIFTPVINLPQTAILGVCTIINRPVDLGNNTFGFVPFIGLSLTYDHRAIDGGPATLFLREIKNEIENFSY